MGGKPTARLDSETVGDIFRSALLVLAFWGLLSGLWPAIGGITGQYAGAAETVKVTKGQGVVTAPWDTMEAPSQSWIKVHVSGATLPVNVLVVALNSRSISISDNGGVAAVDDLLAVGKGTGTDVTITGGHGGPVIYRISVHITADAIATNPNATDADVSYVLNWEVQKLDPLVVVGGLVLFNMFFVTEYMLHMRRDIRSLGRKVERAVAEGPGVRAPSAALGAPVLVAADEESAEGPSRGRGGFFGRFGKEAEENPAPTPAPAAYAPPAPQDMYPPAPYAAPAYSPPPPMAAPPPSYGPAPPAPPTLRSAPMAPAPAPPAPPAPPYTPPAYAPPASAAPPAPAPADTQEPVSKVRCPQCKHIVPVYTAERPTPIRCPNCGKRGMLTK